MGRRDQRLDVLRGIAVLMVLIHHSPLSIYLRGAGWTGVDLFFVLSGFLVSGLLFREYQATGQIRPWRFYFRRGLKIYPSYYALLVAGFGLHAYFDSPLVRFPLGAALFAQNYLGCPAWFGHTWSVAVEEHFYFLLVPGVLLLLDSELFRRAPVRCASVVMTTVAIALLAWRSVLTANGATPMDILDKTHLRLDSLAFGVLLSVVWHFAPERVDTVRRFRVPVLLAGLLFTMPVYVVPYGHVFIRTVGPTMLYLGYGLILAAVLTLPDRVAGPASPALAMVGFYSYSIYLWHIPFAYTLRTADLSPGSFTTIYLLGSLAIGMLMAKVIELPFLRWRDRWFPATPTAPATTSPRTGPEPLRAVPGLRRFLQGAALALGALAVSHFLLGTAARLSGADPSRNRTWVQSNRICPIGTQTPDPTGATCLPGYPAIVTIVVTVLDLREVSAGRLVATTAAWGTLLIVALLMGHARRTQKVLALLLAALLPGFLWWHTVLLFSTVACLSLAALTLGDRGYFLAAGLSAAAAAFSHPVGVLLAVPLAIQAARLPSRSDRAFARTLGIGLSVAGLAAGGALLRASTGEWAPWTRILGVGAPGSPTGTNSRGLAVAIHAILATALLVLAAFHWFRQRQSRPPLEAALLTYAALVWIVALCAGPEARLQIAAVAVVGLVPMLGQLRAVTIAALLAASVTLGCWTSLLFFAGQLR